MEIDKESAAPNFFRLVVAWLYRYRYLLVTGVLLIWVGFLDRYSISARLRDNAELRALKKQEVYYTQQTEELVRQYEELSSSNAALEKFAREKYLMHKPNEEVYVLKPAAKTGD